MPRGGLLRGTDKHCVESPKGKTLCLGIQLEYHGTYALRRRLLHPQHFLKHQVIKDRALQPKISVLDPRGQNQDRTKAVEGYSTESARRIISLPPFVNRDCVSVIWLLVWGLYFTLARLSPVYLFQLFSSPFEWVMERAFTAQKLANATRLPHPFSLLPAHQPRAWCTYGVLSNIFN